MSVSKRLLCYWLGGAVRAWKFGLPEIKFEPITMSIGRVLSPLSWKKKSPFRVQRLGGESSVIKSVMVFGSNRGRSNQNQSARSLRKSAS